MARPRRPEFSTPRLGPVGTILQLVEGLPKKSERADARVPVTLIVEYEGAGDLVEDYSTNLSVGGTFVHTQRHMAKGTPVRG